MTNMLVVPQKSLLSFVLYLAIIVVLSCLIGMSVMKIFLKEDIDYVKRGGLKTNISEAIDKVVTTKLGSIEDVKKLIESGCLIQTLDLIEFEKNFETGKIWVLTQFLEIEKREEMREAIVNNLLDGIEYTYLIPVDRKDDFKNRVSDWLKYAHQKDKSFNKEKLMKQVKCIIVPNHFPYMTVVVYNPHNIAPQVVIKFPYREKSHEDILYEKWMFKVSRGDDAQRICTSIDDLIKSATVTIGCAYKCQYATKFENFID